MTQANIYAAQLQAVHVTAMACQTHAGARSSRKALLEVVRDGKEVQVPVPSVVSGDIAPWPNGSRGLTASSLHCSEQVVLGTGDVVPADLRLFEAKDFKVSEMALTGSRPKGWRFAMLGHVPEWRSGEASLMTWPRPRK